MTAQGSPQTRFRRAIDARSVLLAELCARELRHLDLADALELVVLYAEVGDLKFERAACRWLGRITLERNDVTLSELQLAVAALSALRDHPVSAAVALRSLDR